MIFYLQANFTEKFLWKSGFSLLAKIKMTQNKNRLFGRHFETVQHFIFFFSELWFFYSAYIYGANFTAKFWWKSGFLKC